MSVKEILKGIDEQQTDSEDGWWETSTGAQFGAGKLVEVEQYVDQLQALVERLQLAGRFLLIFGEDSDQYKNAIEILEETPAQSLEAIKREAVREFASWKDNKDFGLHLITVADAEQYIKEQEK